VSKKAIPILALIVLLGSGAAWYWWARIVPAPAPPPPVTAPPPAETAPPITHPMPAAAATASPQLPALADSDTPFHAALVALPGAGTLENFLRPENLIRRVVVTVDNLPRHKLAVEQRPLKATSGTLLIRGGDLEATLDEHNAARYAPLVAILAHLDMRAVSAVYQHYYPLFQQAYQDLGYPQGYFNDRLVAVIDELLATPHPAAPIALVRPKVFWEFADPELEARSAGQKLLMRIGSENAGVVTGKLRELRALVATGSGGTAARPTLNP